MFDIKIKNGTIVDGTGNPWFVADIGITGERISAIGDLSSVKARRTIDATNKIVSPGFCDLHSHSDYLILANPTAESKVTVGVTADISGNCGGSAAPQNEMFWQEWWTPDVDERFKLVTREYAKNTLAMHGIEFDWHTVKEYLDKVRKTGISINYGQLIGHYTLRIAAYGQERRKPTPEELETMKSLLRQGIREGAIGFSTEVGSHFIWEYEIDE
ncbi:MAG: amidohydrolase family protein, partial [Firmicutes bacterium]|nr:amidohydrolase family protein [Candidatus Fermentithermobacillaceae bacterium]